MRIVLFLLFLPIINLHGQNVGIGELSPTARLHVKGSGISYATATLLLQNSSGEALINVRDNGFTGIGTSNPSARLHLRQDFEALRVDGNGSYISFYEGTVYRGYLWQKFGTSIELGSAAGSNLPVTIAPNNVPDVTFLQGFTGIGVSNPSTRLEVDGRIRLRSSATETPGIWFNNFSNSNGAGFVGMATNDTYGFYGALSDWSLLLHKSTGNVSIGTDPGVARLTVRGGTTWPVMDVGTASAGGIALQINGGAFSVYGASVSTPTTAFVHKATAANSPALAYTVIDNIYCNNNPLAILQVTMNGTYGSGASLGYEIVPETITTGSSCQVLSPVSFMIFYNGPNSGFYTAAPAYARDKWCIRVYTSCFVSNPTYFNFNVFVIKTS